MSQVAYRIVECAVVAENQILNGTALRRWMRLLFHYFCRFFPRKKKAWNVVHEASPSLVLTRSPMGQKIKKHLVTVLIIMVKLSSPLEWFSIHYIISIVGLTCIASRVECMRQCATFAIECIRVTMPANTKLDNYIRIVVVIC